jgi:hypothetical protein
MSASAAGKATGDRSNLRPATPLAPVRIVRPAGHVRDYSYSVNTDVARGNAWLAAQTAATSDDKMISPALLGRAPLACFLTLAANLRAKASNS